MGDYRTTTGEAPPLPSRIRRRRRARGLAAAAALLAIAGLAGTRLRVTRVVRAQGHVMTEAYAEVYPAVEGRVAAIEVYGGARVRAGDPLVRLDDAEERTLLAEAVSQHRKAQAELAQRTAEVEERRRRHAVDLAVARLHAEAAQARYARERELFEHRLASAASIEEHRLQKALAQAELESIEAADIGLLEGELRVLAHEAEARAEAVARAEARLAQRTVEAPLGGLVVRYDFALGERIRPDRLLYEIFADDQQVLKVRIPERDAVRVAEGQPYEARLTPFAGRRDARFRGRVLALRDVIQTDERGGYRQATCSFDPGAHAVPIGTSAEVRIRGERVSFWAWLLGLDR